MQQVVTVWNALDARRRVIVLVASVAMFAAVLGLARMAAKPNLTLLYGGLESGTAGEVVAALEQRGIVYDVRGGAIFVESAQRDALRMTLASEGLPSSTTRGYELLDGLSGFGTTSQMFDAAYWRAKEGELARTILAHPSISAARVHIAHSGNNPFRRDTRGSASVAVTTVADGITSKHAKALKFLVASAVPGLSPEDVSIIDGRGELIGAQDEAPVSATDDRSTALRQRVERLLAARVGAGNAVVEVSVDTVTQTESLRERVIDPESRVAISVDTEERSNSASDHGGDVTVASNLPDGDGGQDASSSQTSETRERVNYEISQTEREVTVAPGAIKRLTVAVLVNGIVSQDATGVDVFSPRSEEEIEALRELVASAVGYDEARGDVITIKTMQFDTLGPSGTSAEPSFLASLNLDYMSLIQAAVLALVSIVLGLLVVRPVLMRSAETVPIQLAAPSVGPADSESAPRPTPDQDSQTVALDGEIDTSDLDPNALSLVSSSDKGAPNAEFSLQDALSGGLPALDTAPTDPATRLRGLINQRHDETVEILRSWLEDEEETA